MPFEIDSDGSMLGNALKETRERVSDFLHAFTAGDDGAIVREAGSEQLVARVTDLLRRLGQVDVETIQALRYVAQSTFQMYQDTLKKRLAGTYEVDEFGLDEEFLDLVRPFFTFLYQKWWRVTLHGIENLPQEGPVFLVANHSGVLPWDGAMIATAVYNHTSPPRIVRALYHDWFAQIPFVQPLLARTGQVHACPENAERLLKKGNVACVFPEGIKGVGKLFKERYKLARFGRGGFVKAAIRAKAPIVPISVVGAEEIYPTLARADWLGAPIGSPFFPITPFWPWFGLLGLLPLPTKWSIHFGKPVPMAEYSARDAENFLLVQRLTHRVRDEVQVTLQKAVLRRKSVFV